ncbi:MAG TPA: site-specific integrase, partial [bacterium]|nr:site-specific integrase [bacterium]
MTEKYDKIKAFTGILRNYLNYLFAEKKSSKNTIESYEFDLIAFFEFLTAQNILNIENVSSEIISQYLNNLRLNSKNERTIIRHLVTIRNFFKFLIIENTIKTDPTENIDMPKMSKKLPNYLSYEEIDRLLNAPDTNTIQGKRDKAILEVLYGCGLRISELVELKTKNLYLEEGYIKV